jgi:hypothetical protein
MIKTTIVPGSEVKYGHLTCVVLEDFEDSLLILSKDSNDGETTHELKCEKISELKKYPNTELLEELRTELISVLSMRGNNADSL